MVLAAPCALCGDLIEGLTRPHAVAAWRGHRPLACPSCAPESVYTDGVHLVTPGPEHLVHVLAGEIGLKRAWYQTNGSYPHYDLTSGRKRVLAIRYGAIRVAHKELVSIMQRAGKALRRR